MHRIPIELAERIFELACTDGGPTGAALARTSRSVRAVSAAHRFRTVRLGTLEQTEALLRALDALGPPPRVAHLLLALAPAPSDAAPRAPPPYGVLSSPDELFWLDARQQLADARAKAWALRAHALLLALLPRLAPALASLTLLAARALPLPHARCAFPNLRELTLIGEDDLGASPSPSPFASSHGDGGEPAYPRLARLHLVAHPDRLCPWGTALPLRTWAALAPALTHLRLSHAKFPSVLALREALGVGAGAEEAFYPSLRRVVWQGAGAPQALVDPYVGGMVEECRVRREKGEEGAPVVRVVPHIAGTVTDWERLTGRLERDWEERVEGGQGCWVLGEEEEVQRWAEVACTRT